MAHRIVGWLKLILPLVLIAGLCVHVWWRHPDAVLALTDGSMHGGRLALATAVIFAAQLVAMVRWHLLLRALDIPIRLRDTLRLGFLGHLMNFVAPGQVGGDLFKAVFIAREQTAQRAAAIATIIVDRVFGLYGLLVMTSIALFYFPLAVTQPQVLAIARTTYLITGLTTLGLLVAFLPQVASSQLAHRLARMPRIGPTFARVWVAFLLYRRRWRTLVVVGLMSVLVHVAMALGVYWMASSVYAAIPTLGEHFVVSPLACVAGALPITPGGLGSYELAFSFLYNLLSPSDQQGRGVVISLLVRLAMILSALVGVALYWLNHQEVSRLLHEAESAQDSN